MTLVLTINQETWLKTKPIDSQQLADNAKIKAVVGEKFAPLSWELADNQHIKFGVSSKFFLYAFIPHIALTQDGVDVLAPKFLVTQEQADYIFERSIDALILADLNNALTKFNITDKEDIREFLAQCAHESGGLRYPRELGGIEYFTESYEGREDLGNVEKGDGARFSGAGYLQVTGRFNFQDLSNFLNDPRVMEGTDYVAEHLPFTSAAFWWYKNEMSQYIANGATVEQVSTRVNGANPANGLSDRIYYYNRAKEVI